VVKILEEKITQPSTKITIIAAFAALYIVLSYISPFIPAVGLPEIKINMEASFASLFGVILGPWLGASSAFIGSLGALLLKGANIFDMIFLFNPAFNALIVGLIVKKKWKVSFVIFTLIILAFFLTPVCTPLTEHWFVGVLSTFDKILALLIIIPTIILLNRLKTQKNITSITGYSFIIIFLLAFIGNQADAALGNTIFAQQVVYEGVFQIPLEITRSLFTVSPFIYPIIRIIQTLIAAAAGVPLMRALRRLEVFD